MKKISISTGGTGGHVIPARVLYDYLSDKNDVIITSDNRGLNYLNKNIYKTKTIDVPKITRNILDFIPFLIFFTFSIIKSYFFLRQNKIKVLISTGGYMSIPICLAARILKLKIFLGKTNLRVHTYRWTMFADNDEDAWESLKSWRGLRAPNRLQELDPMVLRETADSLGREEIMSKFSRAGNIEELIDIYKPLVDDFESEIVTIQISSINQPKTIELLGKELLPRLKK